MQVNVDNIDEDLFGSSNASSEPYVPGPSSIEHVRIEATLLVQEAFEDCQVKHRHHACICRLNLQPSALGGSAAQAAQCCFGHPAGAIKAVAQVPPVLRQSNHSCIGACDIATTFTAGCVRLFVLAWRDVATPSKM